MTNVQLQCLLRYLDYYTAGVDGLCGVLTTRAVRAFQKDYGLAVDGLAGPATQKRLLEAVAGQAEKVPAADPWAGIRYFVPRELACKCGGRHCDGFPAQPSAKLLALADRLREHFGVPVTVSSGLRCPAHNQAVGGVSGSRHLYGQAMDLTVAGRTAAQVLSWLQAQPDCHYAYAIDSHYLHMDVAEP